LASTGRRAPLPRFLPPDPRVEEPYLLTPRTALRVAILGVLVLAVFAALFLRLWSLQVLSSQHYLSEALDNQLRVVRQAAPRGPILDRNGHVLVRSVPSQAATLSLASLPKGDGRDTELRKLSMVLHVPMTEIAAKIREHRGDQLTPVTIAVALHPDQVDFLKEHQTEFPGVGIEPTFLRYYNSQGLAAQLFGYVGEISAPELKHVRRCTAAQIQNPPSPSHQCYVAGDRVGQSGIESAYDAYLFGTPGVEEERVDSLGREKGLPLQTKIPASGDALRLTIDIGTQRAAEHALVYGIKLARSQGEYYADGGSIVAMNPNNGDILAMASSPTYRPSVWSGRLDPKKLAPLLNPKVAAKANYPGLNRAIDVGYPPGSTFKPVTALAALEEHLIEPYQTLQCTGSYSVPNQFGGPPQIFFNWDRFVDQPMTMPVALAASCDTYFYQLGYQFYGLPANRGHPLQNWASRFGFGGSTGVDVGPETPGLLPTPEWREQAYTKATDPCCWRVDRIWKPGDSIQLAIGQKDLLVTPMQMARFYSLIANGGRLVTPHVAADVEQPSPNGQPPTVLKEFAPAPPLQSGVDPSALSVVRDGLYQATHASYGTSVAVFGSFPVPVCGKTGTAEKVEAVPGYPNGKIENQSWWIGYAPCDAPKIVVAALIENGGHGGTAAAPTALKVFEQYFHVKAPQQGVIHSD
jgi:penicillin-binding protein 2